MAVRSGPERGGQVSGGGRHGHEGGGGEEGGREGRGERKLTGTGVQHLMFMQVAHFTII